MAFFWVRHPILWWIALGIPLMFYMMLPKKFHDKIYKKYYDTRRKIPIN